MHEHAIKYGEMYLPFDFDLRFMIKESSLQFHLQERQQQFELAGDEEQWRDVLKGHLNQIGFH